jgi:hypothetical protein
MGERIEAGELVQLTANKSNGSVLWSRQRPE